MVTSLANIEKCKKVGRLAGGGEHGGCAALQLRNFGCYIITGRVL